MDSEWKQRLLCGFFIILYVDSFLEVYRIWLNPVFGYLGFSYTQPAPLLSLIMWVTSLLPCTWIPIKITRASMLIYWVLYVVVFIPSMWVPSLVHLQSDNAIISLSITLLVGFYMLGISYHFKPFSVSTRIIPKRFFWSIFALTLIIFLVVVIIAFRGKMELVKIEDIYGQRMEAKAILKSSLVGYPVTLLQGLFAPVLLSLGLIWRKYHLFVFGVVIQILLYACLAYKAALGSILFTLVFFILMKFGLSRFGIVLPAAMALFMGVMRVVLGFKGIATTKFAAQLASVFVMRTIAGPGLLAAQYQAFFENHPHTFWSHLTGINQVITYPYRETLGVTIGYYFLGNPDLNANANMWVTDGVAAAGLPGIIIISIVGGIVFWLIDSVSQRHSIWFGSLILTYSALNLANVSLFTTLVSGGLLGMIAMLAFMPLIKERVSDQI